MSPAEESQTVEKSPVENDGESREMEEKSLDQMDQVDVDSSTARKFCKTLDVLLADVDNNDNLYTAVRQCLHKVNRISRSSLSPVRSPRAQADRGGVSRESIGKLSAIKAFFEMNIQTRKKTKKKTVMDKLTSSLGLKKRGSFSDEYPRRSVWT
ncbi:PREDICTED: uncharacterized protein LOC107194644 [Dufourea novaeangliae]|uniref:uncharacterized protein LOC107194644 n=1 Tax=Dufourea novaeangliae TaxID=178035 RepID=UPI0007671ABE|nr:PREDICTED: uncharacterized protein LOC107194644 [Dufourea novaeangliae]